MKIKLNIKSIIFMAIIAIASMLFINISFAGNTGKIIVETAKLREQANTDSKVLELASQGEEIEILNEEDEWYKVKYKNITGYVRKDLIELENKETVNATNTTETEEDKNESTNESTETVKSENSTTTEAVEEKAEETENISKNEKAKLMENVKLKVIPLISSIDIAEVKQNEEIEITETLNDWVKVKTSDGREGWMVRKITVSTGEQKALLALPDDNSSSESNTSEQTTQQTTQQTNTTKTMYVNSQTVNLRQQADKTSKVVKQLAQNTKVTVMSTDNGWAYVDINGTKGYIAENLLTTTQKESSRSGLTTREQAAANKTTTQAKETTTTKTAVTETTKKDTTKAVETTSSSTASGNSVVSYAKQLLGCKYVYGGTSTKGFDCSGFTQYVYKHFGINLNRTAAAQYSNGKSVTELQAGDLVMFGKSGINHVGIYIGGNTFIHAANPSRGVTTDSLSTGYYKTNYVGARRIF